MENAQKKFIVRKILLALLPTIVFWQNYAWMTMNAFLGIAFLVIWALMVWNVWQFTEKNHIMERFFRLTEIAFFLLPLSAIVFSFVLGSQAVSSTTNEFEQAGAAIGTAIGGTFVVILAFIIGLIGGIIMHLVTGKYDKKANESKEKQPENLSANHGVILSLVAIILLAIIMGTASSGNKTGQKNTPTNTITSTTTTEPSEQEVPTKPKNSRTNPAGFNEIFTITKDDFLSGKVSYEIELVDTISGNEALTLVNNANQFNDTPKENEEYILAKFRVKILETENDKPYNINNSQFQAISKGGIAYDKFLSVSGLEPSLSKDLYSGAEHTGYTYFIVNKDDSPVISHLKGTSSEIWFNLRIK